MTSLIKDIWRTGTREEIDYNDIMDILRRVEKYANHLIIIGTDSVKLNEKFIFTNTICILNKNGDHDRRYFYNRKKVKDDSYYDLSKRLLKETSESIEIAMFLKSFLNYPNIEVHVDINKDEKHKSSKFKNVLIGYVTGCGFDCKIKPESFVASSIADNHTRKV